MHVCGNGISLDWQAEATQLRFVRRNYGSHPICGILLDLKSRFPKRLMMKHRTSKFGVFKVGFIIMNAVIKSNLQFLHTSPTHFEATSGTFAVSLLDTIVCIA